MRVHFVRVCGRDRRRHCYTPFVQLLIVVSVRELVPVPVAVVHVVADCDFFLALLCQSLDEVRRHFFQPELLRGFVALISSEDYKLARPVAQDKRTRLEVVRIVFNRLTKRVEAVLVDCSRIVFELVQF